MMLDILTGDQNIILRKKCIRVEKFDDALAKFVDQMMDVIQKKDSEGEVIGVGLAANQVGKSLRVLLITLNVGTRKDKKIISLINPEILQVSPQKIMMEEGCLSVPGVFEKIARPAKVKVRWQNLDGNWCEKKFSGWDARVFLHEFDHLEGVLFTDYLKKGQRGNISRQESIR